MFFGKIKQVKYLFNISQKYEQRFHKPQNLK